MKHAWIVDDEHDIADAIAMVLEVFGFESRIFPNGKVAADYFNSAEAALPDIVFLDVMMPFMSGYDVLRVLRGSEKGKRLPVILMSAVNPAMAQSDYGWNEFLKKPFTLEKIENVVERFIA